MSTYQVGVEIALKSNVVAVLESMGRELRGFEKQVMQATEQVDRLAGALRKLGGVDKAVSALVGSMDRLKSATSGSGSIEANFDRAAVAMRSVVSQSERLTQVTRENIKLSQDLAKVTNRSASAGNATRQATRTQRGGGHFGLGEAVMLGATGAAITHVGAEAIGKGMRFEEMASFIGSDNRVTPADLARMKTLADQTTKTAPGSTPVENLGLLYDLKNIVGDVGMAEKLLPQVANLESALRLIDRKNGGSGDAGFAAAKALELTGGLIGERHRPDGTIERFVDPEKLARNLNSITSSTLQYGGRGYNPQEALGFAKQARVAGMQLSDDYLYGVAPAITQATGGRIQGTALMSAAQVFEGGKLTPKSMDAMIRYGLAGDGGLTSEKDPRTGKKRQVVHADQIFDLDLLRSNPYEWTKKAGARLDAKGIHGDDQLGVLMKVMQRSTMAGLFADLLKLSPTIDKDLETRAHMRPDISGYLQQNDPMAKLQQFNAAWERLLTILGGAMMSDALGLLDRLTAALTWLGDAAQKHPDTARILSEIAVAVGAVAAACAAAWITIAPVLAAVRAAGYVVPTAVAAAETVGGLAAAPVVVTVGGLAAAHEGMNPLTPGQAARHAPWADPNADTIYGDGYTADGRTAEQVAQKLNAAADKLAAVPPPPAVQQTVQVRTQIDLSGRLIGEAVTEHVVRQLDRPGTGGYDVRLGPLHPATPW